MQAQLAAAIQALNPQQQQAVAQQQQALAQHGYSPEQIQQVIGHQIAQLQQQQHALQLQQQQALQLQQQQAQQLQAQQQAQAQQQQQQAQQQQQQAQQQAQRAEEERREQRRRGEAASAQAEMREKLAAAERVKCHLHKKPKAGCKFCAKHQDAMEAAQKKPEPAKPERRRGRRIDRAISEDRDDRRGPLELANPKTFGLSGLLQTHIVECAHYKSLLTLDTFDQVTDETFQFATAVEPYMANSGTVPSALFCCLYRFFTLGLDRSRLQKLMDSQESPFIRCAGFLYVRFGLPHDQLLGWLGDYILDDEEFKPSAETDQRLTIGEFVEALLSQDRYYNTVLPRLPMVTKRAVEERLAPLGQNRKRMQANKSIIDKFRDRGCRVEANIDGEWMPGAVVELDEERPNRPTVRVRLDDGGEEYVLLGKVILSSRGGGRERSRSRGRRGGGGGDRTDWSREKGRSDKELLEEMRSREREKAVCSSGKDYARRPVGYKEACALPREQGTQSYRLMEQETFVPMSSRAKRTSMPSPEPERAPVRQSAEHQARMQQLFEKYGNVKSAAETTKQSDGVDRPDVMRLG